MGGDRCGARLRGEWERRQSSERGRDPPYLREDVNRFQIMEYKGVDEDDTTMDEGIFMGDSIIWKFDGTMCGKKTKTTTVCLPGAGVRKRVGRVQVRRGWVYPGT